MLWTGSAQVTSVDPLRPTARGAKRLLARQLRRDATPAERHAWSLLRRRQILGLKFRRQHVVDGFVVDFYCAELRLVIELDGSPHEESERSSYDAARTAWLAARGRRVLRLPNRDLTHERVSELIRRLLHGIST
jgi:very-short-patch-repair endonuclease